MVVFFVLQASSISTVFTYDLFQHICLCETLAFKCYINEINLEGIITKQTLYICKICAYKLLRNFWVDE